MRCSPRLTSPARRGRYPARASEPVMSAPRGATSESLPNAPGAPNDRGAVTTRRPPVATTGPGHASEPQRAIPHLPCACSTSGRGTLILIENGGSRVLIDGGPDVTRFGRLLDQFRDHRKRGGRGHPHARALRSL
jgi:hypothetical protein